MRILVVEDDWIFSRVRSFGPDRRSSSSRVSSACSNISCVTRTGSSPRPYDQKVVQAKISEYALVERTDGLPALIRNIQLEQENNLESGLLIRLADSDNRTLTETIPSRWKATDLKKIENRSVPVSEEQWRFPVSNEHGDVLDVFSCRLSDGSILQLGKKPQKPGRLLDETDVAIRVRDNGIGIPAQDLPRIFDRLFRGEKGRSQRGLGLGLSMVQAVICAHKGRIEVESNPGQGSTFKVLLPVAAPPHCPAS